MQDTKVLKKKIKEKTLDNQFYNDTIVQLKGGMTCYLYKPEQVELIKKIYHEKTKLELEVDKKDYYWIVKPFKKVRKYRM